jgi:hypothetical protein
MLTAMEELQKFLKAAEEGTKKNVYPCHIEHSSRLFSKSLACYKNLQLVEIKLRDVQHTKRYDVFLESFFNSKEYEANETACRVGAKFVQCNIELSIIENNGKSRFT